MTEDLVRSASSQRSNPRGLRRVRPVPYECCGGVCSFLNSGCFTLCCNGQKTRRRSSVYMPNRSTKEEVEDVVKDGLEGQLSETTKRLIKPNSLDGLTEADLYAFERGLGSDEEFQTKQRFVNSFDIDLDVLPQRAESEELLTEEKIYAEDEISVLTDDTNASTADEGAHKKKNKKKILSILKIKRKRKNQDGVSVTSSATSLACSETLDRQDEDDILEKTEASLSMKAEKDEVPVEDTEKKEKGTVMSRRLHSVFSSIRGKKGKKKDDKLAQTNSDSKNVEEEVNNVKKVIPLGFGTQKPPPDLEINDQKKPFWKSFSKKDKKKPKGDNKEIVDGIKLQEETKPAVELGADASKVFGADSPTVQSRGEEPKKKTLLETFNLSKKEDGSSHLKKESQIPCLLTACVNSDIKPESERKNSTDSVEVRTIADEDLETDGNTIKIVRNQFFPDEIHRNSDIPADSNAQEVEEVDVEEEEMAESEVKEKQINSDVASEPDNEAGEVFGKCEVQDSPLSAKKYKVFDKEDFSESLHTLVDENGVTLLVPSSALKEITTIGSEIEEKIEEVADVAEGIFRTSCSLSIEGSEEVREPVEKEDPTEKLEELTENPVEGGKVEEVADTAEIISEETKEDEATKNDETLDEEEKVEILVVEEAVAADPSSENLVSSCETLTEVAVDSNQSTEEPKNSEEASANTSWIEVANVEDLSESQFNYIYKTTLRAVRRSQSSIGDGAEVKNEVDENVEDQIEPAQMDNGCEVCGKSLEDKTGEGPKEKTNCVCTSLTKPRQSLTEIEQGSVKSKVDAFNQSKQPIIMPLSSGEFFKKDDVMISEAQSSPTLGSKSKSATPSPIAAKSRSGTLSSTNSEWQNQEEDLDRMIQGRGSLSGLGLRSDSMASVYSGAGEGRYGTVAVRGQVEFGLQYNYKAGALEIHVKQCKDLAPVDTKRNRSDPYVKVYLLPDKSKNGKRKTKVKKHTLNPVFDETLKFHISLNGLETRTLWLTVWHSDMFGRNDFLGEVMMSLENKVFDDPAPVWYNLQERTEPFDDTISFKGDIIVCLKFVPPDMTVPKKGKRSRGTLHVLVKEAKYLTAYKANGTSDPFCKSYLLPDKGRNSKQKTPVVKKTVNPVWNHTFIYEDVTLQELAERCLELTVWDHDRLASNEFLGGVRFSLGTGKHYGKPVEWMDATGKELTLWKSMLERPNFWVEGCLSLRPSLDARAS